MPRRDGAVEQSTIHVGVRRPSRFAFQARQRCMEQGCRNPGDRHGRARDRCVTRAGGILVWLRTHTFTPVRVRSQPAENRT